MARETICLAIASAIFLLTLLFYWRWRRGAGERERKRKEREKIQQEQEKIQQEQREKVKEMLKNYKFAVVIRKPDGRKTWIESEFIKVFIEKGARIVSLKEGDLNKVMAGDLSTLPAEISFIVIGTALGSTSNPFDYRVMRLNGEILMADFLEFLKERELVERSVGKIISVLSRLDKTPASSAAK